MSNSFTARWGLLLLAFTLSLLGVPACAVFPIDPASTRAIPAFTIPPVQAGIAYERFMVIGDMGTGSGDQREIAEAMAGRAASDNLDYIVTVGDNFYPDGVSSADDPQWETKFLDVYSDPALAVPVYASLGNHDHKGNAAAQVEFGRRNPLWIMPDLYYTFTRTLSDGTNIQFFAIDTDPIKKSAGSASAQLAWLDSELAKSDASWKFVFGHHPVYSHGAHGPTRELIEELEPLLSKHHVDVYFCGHDHTLEMIKPVRGVHYVISGAAAGRSKAYPVLWTDNAFYAATGDGFVFARVSRGQLVLEFVRRNGITQYAHVLTKGNST